MIVEAAMNDKQVADRVKGQLYRKALDSVTGILPVTSSARHSEPTPPPEPVASPPGAATSTPPHDALQVLTLAQRTAESHIAAVRRQASEVQAEAQALAEQIHRDARRYADKVCAEADDALVEARAGMELSRSDADAQAAEIRRQAELVLTDARAEAERIVADGRERAEQLKLRAQQRYEDSVGGLSVEREALQRQIEALAVFDNDHRHRLTSFLQSQLRILWSDQPQAGDVPGPDGEGEAPGGPIGPAA